VAEVHNSEHVINSRAEIAAALGMTSGTLKTHLKRLAEKLEVANYVELRRHARLLLG
jgi:DNA-binding CsgD family transcriptional regulator